MFGKNHHTIDLTNYIPQTKAEFEAKEKEKMEKKTNKKIDNKSHPISDLEDAKEYKVDHDNINTNDTVNTNPNENDNNPHTEKKTAHVNQNVNLEHIAMTTAKECKYVCAINTFVANKKTHLNVNKNDIIEVIYRDRDGWFVGRNWFTKKDGYFPGSITKPVGNDINDIQTAIGSDVFRKKLNDEKLLNGRNNELQNEIDRLQSKLDNEMSKNRRMSISWDENKKENANIIKELNKQLKQKKLEFVQMEAVLESLKNDELTRKKQMEFMKKQKLRLRK